MPFTDEQAREFLRAGSEARRQAGGLSDEEIQAFLKGGQPLGFRSEGNAPAATSPLDEAATISERAFSAFGNLFKAGVDLAATLPQVAADIGGIISRKSGADIPQEAFETQKLANRIRGAADRLFPQDPRLAGSFLDTTLPAAFGSAGSLIIGGGLLKQGAKGIAKLGSMLGGSEFYRDAKENNATENQSITAGLIGAGVGLTEAIPLGNFLGRIVGELPQEAAKTFTKKLFEAGAEGVAEALQEAFQGIAQNVTAQQIGYDPERETLEGVPEGTKAGGIVGFTLSLLSNAFGGRRLRSRQEQQNRLIAETERQDNGETRNGNQSRSGDAVDTERGAVAEGTTELREPVESERGSGVNDDNGEQALESGESGTIEIPVTESGVLPTVTRAEFVGEIPSEEVSREEFNDIFTEAEANAAPIQFRTADEVDVEAVTDLPANPGSALVLAINPETGQAYPLRFDGYVDFTGSRTKEQLKQAASRGRPPVQESLTPAQSIPVIGREGEFVASSGSSGLTVRALQAAGYQVEGIPNYQEATAARRIGAPVNNFQGLTADQVRSGDFSLTTEERAQARSQGAEALPPPQTPSEPSGPATPSGTSGGGANLPPRQTGLPVPTASPNLRRPTTALSRIRQDQQFNAEFPRIAQRLNEGTYFYENNAQRSRLASRLVDHFDGDLLEASRQLRSEGYLIGLPESLRYVALGNLVERLRVQQRQMTDPTAIRNNLDEQQAVWQFLQQSLSRTGQDLQAGAQIAEQFSPLFWVNRLIGEVGSARRRLVTPETTEDVKDAVHDASRETRVNSRNVKPKKKAAEKRRKAAKKRGADDRSLTQQYRDAAVQSINRIFFGKESQQPKLAALFSRLVNEVTSENEKGKPSPPKTIGQVVGEWVLNREQVEAAISQFESTLDQSIKDKKITPKQAKDALAAIGKARDLVFDKAGSNALNVILREFNLKLNDLLRLPEVVQTEVLERADNFINTHPELASVSESDKAEIIKSLRKAYSDARAKLTEKKPKAAAKRTRRQEPQAKEPGPSITEQYVDSTAKSLERIFFGDPAAKPKLESLFRRITNELSSEKPVSTEKPPDRTLGQVVGEWILNPEKAERAANRFEDLVAQAVESNTITPAQASEAMTAIDKARSLVFKKAGKKSLDVVLKTTGIDFNEILQQALVEQGDFLTTVTEFLMADSELSEVSSEDVALLAEAVVHEFESRRADILSRRIEQMTRIPDKKPKKKKEFIQKLDDLARLGNLREPDIMDALVNTFNELQPLTAEQREQVISMVEKMQVTPEGIPRNRMHQEILDFIGRVSGIPKREFITSFWYAAVLSGTGTQAVNTVSTAINVALEVTSIAATNPRLAPQLIRNALNAAVTTATQEFVPIVIQGDFTNRIRSEVTRANNALELAQNTPNTLARLFTKGKYVGRFMAWMDTVNGAAAMRARLYLTAYNKANQSVPENGTVEAELQRLLGSTADQRKAAQIQAESEARDGIIPNNLLEINRRMRNLVDLQTDPELLQDAQDYAMSATFNMRPNGFLGSVAGALNTLKNRYPLVVTPIIPFVNIPFNFTNQALNFTPWGLVRLWRNSGQLGSTGGVFTSGNPELHELDFQALRAKTIFGNVALATIAGLAMSYLFDDDEDKSDPWFAINGGWFGLSRAQRGQLMSAGQRPWSLKIGKGSGAKTIQFKDTPLALLLGSIGVVSDQIRFNDATVADVLPNFAGLVVQGFGLISDMNALSTLMDLAETVRAEDQDLSLNKAAQALARPVTGFVPNLAKEVDSWIDPRIFRAEQPWDYALKDVPVVRQLSNLKPMINVLGEEIEVRRTPWRRFIDSQEGDPVWDAIAARANEGLFLPSTRKFSVTRRDGVRETITDDEFYEYQLAVGRAYRRWFSRNLRRFEGMNREQVEQVYEEEFAEIRSIERDRLRAALSRKRSQ